MKRVHIGSFFIAAHLALGACNSWLDKRDYGFLFWPKNHKGRYLYDIRKIFRVLDPSPLSAFGSDIQC